MLILLPPSEKKSANSGPAISVYTGVLYKAIDWTSLEEPAQARGAGTIAIISAKYGALRPLDPISPYKAKINTAELRDSVTKTLAAIDTPLIIDARSSTYKGVWTPPHGKSVDIKIFTHVDGAKKIITHMSKKTRGEVTRLLLLSKTIPTSPQELADIVSAQFDCELFSPTRTTAWRLEVATLTV